MLTRVDRFGFQNIIQQRQGVWGEKMDISSKTACSPFFGCHFRSKKQFQIFFSKIFIFGRLPVKKPVFGPPRAKYHCFEVITCSLLQIAQQCRFGRTMLVYIYVLMYFTEVYSEDLCHYRGLRPIFWSKIGLKC